MGKDGDLHPVRPVVRPPFLPPTPGGVHIDEAAGLTGCLTPLTTFAVVFCPSVEYTSTLGKRSAGLGASLGAGVGVLLRQ